MPEPVTYEDVEAAAERIRGDIYLSPCPESVPLSDATDCQIACKLDYLQRTGSFKERGALNALLLLDEADQKRGVIAASAGNHALALAYHGQRLGIAVSVVMPRFAPMTKRSLCHKLGASVILEGDSFDQALGHARGLAESQGLTYIHGYDDPSVIAGQGTMGLEILEQVPDVEAVVVPVGGGGLVAGLGLAIKRHKPDVVLVAVEPARAASFHAAWEAGGPMAVEVQSTLADGLAVAQVGENAFDAARRLVDEVVVLEEREIAVAVLRLLELEKSVVEGAGAASLAALLAGKLPQLAGRKVVLPLCGGNIDSPVIGQVIERGLAADGRLWRFTARISDRPGGLARFSGLIADAGGSIRQIHHERAFAGEDLATVEIECTVETRDADHGEALRRELEANGVHWRPMQ